MTDDVAALSRLDSACAGGCQFERIAEESARRISQAHEDGQREALLRIRELEAERDSWKEEHGKLLDDIGEYMAKENTERAALGDAIRAKTIEECAQAMVFLPEGQRKIAQEAIRRIAIRALAHASTSAQ